MLRVEEGLFDRVRGKRAGNVVGGRGFLVAAEAAQQVGACRVEQVVAVQGSRARGTAQPTRPSHRFPWN